MAYAQLKNWKGLDLKKWNTTLYPSGAEGFVRKLAGGDKLLAMVYYTNGFTLDTPHQIDWPMAKSSAWTRQLGNFGCALVFERE